MKDRIKLIMESQHMTQQTFSQFIGISSAALSNIFNGRTKPTLNTVEAICQKIPGISLEWLMMGKGTMLENQGANSTEAPRNQENTLFPPTDTIQSKSDSKIGPKRKEETVKKVEQDKESNIKGLKISDKTQRHITEIRVYFDDQTYETFVPDKS